MIRLSAKRIGMASSQIATLLVATFAFAFLVGQIGFVSAVRVMPNGGTCISSDNCQSNYCNTEISQCQDAPAQQAPPGTPLPASNGGGYSAAAECGSTGGSWDGITCNYGGSTGAGTQPQEQPTEESICTREGGEWKNGVCDYSALGSLGDQKKENQASQAGWAAAGAGLLKIGGAIAQGAAWAAGVYYFTGLIKGLIGLKPGDPWYGVYTAGQFVATGFVFGMTAIPTIMTTLGVASTSFFASALGGGLIGAGLALIAFLIFYKETKQDVVIITCIPWQAPTGGVDCEKCGQNGLPCTAYQCASLGKACQLLNAQGSGKPVCVWVDKGDITPPTMTLLNVLPIGYTSTPLTATAPGDTGVLVQSGQDGGLIPPFSTLSLGITTDKVSHCKVDSVRGDNFKDMAYNMIGGVDGTEGLWGKNHTINLPIVQPANSGVSAQTSGQFDLYIRCENANGAATPEAFDFQFVVDTTPDKTAPQILGTSILNGGPVPFGTTSTVVRVYTNEPVPSNGGCKWTHNVGYSYTDMENNMACSSYMNMQGTYSGTYTCTANLTGIRNGAENDFYFACTDLNGNVDTQNYPYSLVGTQPLIISSVTPANGTTIKDSTQSVKVTLSVQTSAGQNQGQATCYYSPSANPSGYKQFSNTNSYQSTQDLWLPAGAYNYYIKCVDLGGNAAYSSVSFNVMTDTQVPNVVRASHDGSNLNIQTDEQATCVYDILDCTYPFESGTSMSSSDGLTFSTAWVAGRTYYIKCQDSFGNAPAPNSCNIVLSPSSV